MARFPFKPTPELLRATRALAAVDPTLKVHPKLRAALGGPLDPGAASAAPPPSGDCGAAAPATDRSE